jgi:multisubunit Na+/H+ antiporter MnhG subunit
MSPLKRQLTFYALLAILANIVVIYMTPSQIFHIGNIIAIIFVTVTTVFMLKNKNI